MEEVFIREQLIYHFARFCYQNRHRLTPKGGITWAEHFHIKHGEPLKEYIRRAKAENYKERFLR